MIVADTGAVVALVDADDKHHETMRGRFEEDPDEWVLPWSILPEVDYLLGAHVGRRAQNAFFRDLASGAFAIDRGQPDDLLRAEALHARYASLHLGLVDTTVIAIAERLKAHTIATLDVRHFGAVAIKGKPRLFPRDG